MHAEIAIRIRRAGAIAAALAATVAASGCGQHQDAGEIEGGPLPAGILQSRANADAGAARALASSTSAPPPAKQILFGDLHVHTTFSADAFMMGLPIMQGEGTHPIADACDYARYCSGLDFWSITDHAESITPRRWQETQEAIRQCNAVAGDPENPDVAAFLGWEWTQIGSTPENHYGHKNVILRDIEGDRVPRRPIHSASFAARAMRAGLGIGQRLLLPLADFPNRQVYFDMLQFLDELRDTPLCEDGVDTTQLPDDCSEGADTPEKLFAKLDQWGYPALVIPHGTTWGIYTPPGSAWDKQLTAQQHDPDYQKLIEVFSGHGNSEEYREFQEIAYDEGGNAVCPEPQGAYVPCCWQAGEIIRSRCADPHDAVCEERVDAARANFLAAGARGRLTVPGAQVEDWKSCGTCPDCFLPAFNYRPKSSVQYILSLSSFENQSVDPMRFRFGFIASSDNHSARPGTGYKEYDRIPNTEARGPRDATWYDRVNDGIPREPAPESVPFDGARSALQQFQVLDFERQASFFLTGGLVAVHADGRSRARVWDALQRREVYGTSGDRILLWFDLVNGADGGVVPMGSAARVAEAPRFRVRAAGALEQAEGCPDVSREGLSAERLERLCRGECFHPADARRRITRVEVVRIRPAEQPGEPIAERIQDPWRTIPCPGDPAGCSVEFDDPEFLAESREVLYYVRAIQEPTLTVNAGLERCTKDESGRCVDANPCYGDYRTPLSDDCAAPSEERAWSSPIYVTR
ncbi:MAG: hypothetical protein DCC71_16720 [Proteobacteria bacterium]|nr:MAG: hypothetical protein DCC71_16720 [Pseudomonadota bacterium]